MHLLVNLWENPSMAPSAPRLLLVRHGRTAWSVSGRHTGRTDVPLLDEGRADAKALGERLRRAPWSWLREAEVRTSPLVRAAETAALAGFGGRAVPWDTLMEFDYGAYEGLTPAQIAAARPGWFIWRDGVPGGESLAEVAARAARVVDWARSLERDTAVVAHGHILRAVAARWLGEDVSFASRIRLAPASVSVLGHAYGAPALEVWNDTAHLED